MIDDLFERTRGMFDLPNGVVYLDGNSLGAMPKCARDRVRRELDESWGRELIRAWNSAGWIDLPAQVGDLIGEGAAQERGVVGETPNLAARLQGLAAPNTLVIAEATRRQVGGLFDLADLGPKRLLGSPSLRRRGGLLARAAC